MKAYVCGEKTLWYGAPLSLHNQKQDAQQVRTPVPQSVYVVFSSSEDRRTYTRWFTGNKKTVSPEI